MSNDFAKPDRYPVDGRGITSSIASIGIKHLEVGQLYLMTVMDKDGNALDEASSYRLAVPAKVPINQYWSATTYDRATHAFIRGMERFGRSSQNPDLQVNPATAPSIATLEPRNHDGEETGGPPPKRRGTEFEVLFRFYGPGATALGENMEAARHRERLPQGRRPNRVTSRPRTSFAPRRERPQFWPRRQRRQLRHSSITFASLPHRKSNHHPGSAAIRSTPAAVFDLHAGPVTITLPNAGKRFMSMEVIDEDQYALEVEYGAGTYTLTKDKDRNTLCPGCGSGVVNPDDAKDLEAVHALQDAIKVDPAGQPRPSS